MICLSDIKTELDIRAWSSGERRGGDINIEVIGTCRYFKLRGRMRSSRERVWRKERKWPWGGSMSGRRGGIKKRDCGAALVAQWLGIRLPVQGTRVRALVWEDPTCHIPKPVRHNY